MTQQFQRKSLPGNIEQLTWDAPGQKVNTFTADVIQELSVIITELAQRTDLRGLLVSSGKPGQFIAGADLHDLADSTPAAQERWTKAILDGSRLMTVLSELPFPTVSLINGVCLGGGTELALATDFRVAANAPQVKIGLPEVKLGLIPGWGGTQRLPRLVGVEAAWEMVTSGEPVDARRAGELNLIDRSAPADQLLSAGVTLIEESHQTGVWQTARHQRRQAINDGVDRLQALFSAAESRLIKKTRGHYPAPLMALQAIRDGIQHPLSDGLSIEQSFFLKLIGTPISSNLIAQFFITTRLQRETGVDNPSVRPRSIESVGVLGAGLMGSGIATAHARRSIRAVMVDIDDARVEDGLQRARQVVEDRIASGRATSDDLAALSSLLMGSTSLQDFSACDLVIEAVTENETLKTKILKDLGGKLRSDALLASNTSTISITRLAQASPAPERFAGMHFFSPVDRMQLVEVVRGEQTSDETVVTLVALAKRIGKTPIVVRDCPGFLVNRILLPYMAEALVLLEEGVEMDRIDRVATEWGMPVGPIALYDMVGLDTGLYAGEVLQAGYPDRAVATPLLAELVRRGRMGKKSGKGFRGLDAKGKFVTDPDVQHLISQRVRQNCEWTDAEISDRLFLCLTLEAVRAWEEKIVRQPGDLDMALLLGVNFPTFRGGPLRWCDTEGAAQIIHRAKPWESLGGRYAIPAALADAAAHGRRFYASSG